MTVSPHILFVAGAAIIGTAMMRAEGSGNARTDPGARLKPHPLQIPDPFWDFKSRRGKPTAAQIRASLVDNPIEPTRSQLDQLTRLLETGQMRRARRYLTTTISSGLKAQLKARGFVGISKAAFGKLDLGTVLARADLSGLNLTNYGETGVGPGANFSGMDLVDINLRGSNISHANFRASDLSYAKI